jgi:hypothetical protein
VNAEEQLTSTRLWLSIVNIDLQLYKASIYKQRWGTPGGIDQALPCYDEALTTLGETAWPESLRGEADDLARRIASFKETLNARDVTIASAAQTKMMVSFEDLRDGVRHWPKPRPTATRGSQGARDFVVTAGERGQQSSM